jgi:hypothetical protein
MTEGDGKMDSLCVYKVVIDSSTTGQATYLKEYVGPATCEHDAVEQARGTFKEGPGCRVQAVEVLDRINVGPEAA